MSYSSNNHQGPILQNIFSISQPTIRTQGVVRNTITYLSPSANPGAVLAVTASNSHQQEHQRAPREFVPDMPSAYHGMMTGLPMASHPQPVFGQNQDPVYGNIDDLYDEDEIQPMITNDQIRFNNIQDSYHQQQEQQQLMAAAAAQSQEEGEPQPIFVAENEPKVCQYFLKTLKTPLTKYLREKVRCIEGYEIVQGALDYNSYLIKNLILNKRQRKSLDKSQKHYVMKELELNIKKLAMLADESLAIREYTFDNAGDAVGQNSDAQNNKTRFPTTAIVKGIMNETRASKISYSELLRNENFTNDYLKLNKFIDSLEIKMPVLSGKRSKK